jgi:membrane protease YdiL (CAAX protease family)
MSKTLRNLIIFTVATLSAGFLGLALDKVAPSPDPQERLGMLIWLVTPLAATLLLRAFGGDGWQDFGIKPNLKSGWMWYMAALLIVPLVVLMTMGLGAVFGAFSLSGFAMQGFGAFVSFTGIAFASSLVKNIFEEFAWRGYLTPRFEALKLNPIANHLLTGIIWGGWHIPYWLYLLDRGVFQSQTTLNVTSFILVGLIILPLHALTYGELRLLSKSVWPGLLMHSLANALSLALLTNQFVEPNGRVGVVLSPGGDGIVHAVLFALIGIGLYRYRMKRSPREYPTAKNVLDGRGIPE